jgi:hypothetical protein
MPKNITTIEKLKAEIAQAEVAITKKGVVIKGMDILEDIANSDISRPIWLRRVLGASR